MPGFVFISAKSEDYHFAGEIADFLAKNGIECFFAERTLLERGEAGYRRVIDEALETATHLVVVTSSREHALSRWVEYEWGFFQNEILSGRKKGNLLTVACNGLPPSVLPAGLRAYQVIKFDSELSRLPAFLPGLRAEGASQVAPPSMPAPVQAAQQQQPIPQYTPPPAQFTPSPAQQRHAAAPPPLPPMAAPIPAPAPSSGGRYNKLATILAFVTLLVALGVVVWDVKKDSGGSKGGKNDQGESDATKQERQRLEQQARDAEQARKDADAKQMALEEERKKAEAEKQRLADERDAAARLARERDAEMKRQEQLKKDGDSNLGNLGRTFVVPKDYEHLYDAMKAAKKGDTIQVRAGTYDNDGFEMKNGVTVMGDGRDRVIVRCKPEYCGFVVKDCPTGRISGITFEHNAKAKTGKENECYVGYIGAGSSIELVDCRIRNSAGFGLLINNGAKPLVRDCAFEKCPLSGIRVEKPDTNPTLRDNRCESNTEAGIAIAIGAQATVERNRCINNKFSGISVEGANVQLISNTCDGNNKNGIAVIDGGKVVARRNSCSGNMIHGIGAWDKGSQVELTENTCRNNEVHGIMMTAGVSGQIFDNVCTGNKSCGFGDFGSISGTRYSGNTASNNTKHGFQIAESSAALLEDNESSGNKSSGIAVFDQGTAPTLRKNRLIRNEGYGIFIEAIARPVLEQNSYESNALGDVGRPSANGKKN